MIRIDIDVREVEKAVAQLEGFRQRKEAQLQIAVKKGGEAIEDFARKKMVGNDMIDTGELYRSVESVHTGWDSLIGTPHMYGLYQEYGTGIYAVKGDGRKTPWWYYYRGRKGPHGWRFTRGNKPQPWLVPAFTEGIPVFQKKIIEALRGL